VAAAALLRAATEGRPAVSGPHLVVRTGANPGAVIPLGSEQTLGRGRAADVRLADPLASRLHARIRVGMAGATVEDTGSKNGLRVNGARVGRTPRPIRPGDEIAVGATVLAFASSQAGVVGVVPGLAGAGVPPAAPQVRRRWLVTALLLASAALAMAAAA
jgi:pSer/pThr/pTyr-binding forkhead associated (FHA) protein